MTSRHRCGERCELPDGRCALDVAGRGPLTLEEVAKIFEVTRERIRQIEAKALRKLRTACDRRGLELHDLIPDARPEVADRTRTSAGSAPEPVAVGPDRDRRRRWAQVQTRAHARVNQ